MIFNGPVVALGNVCPRWVFRRVFVADGNFKADHVRQDKAAADIWLSEGGGMDPPRWEYRQFLKTAIERLTVRFLVLYVLNNV